MYAQPTGYQGKRMMFKTDLVSPLTERGVHIGLDYVLLRNLVIGADFSITGKQYKQNYGSFPDAKARIRDAQIGITGQYFLNNALPAPTGSYVFGKYAIGQAAVFGSELIPDPTDPTDNILRGFKIEDIPSRQLDIGFGYQEVVYGFLLLDFDFGISAASLFLDKSSNGDETRNNLVDQFAAKHGPNLYSLGSWRSQPGGIGLSMHIKVGILLF